MKAAQVLSAIFIFVTLSEADVVDPFSLYRNASEIGFELESPIVTNFGTWGEPEYCPPGQVVTGFQLKMEPKSSVDDTALNGIRFYCSDPVGSRDARRNITSKVGRFGNWGRVYDCTTYAIGFELESQKHLGPELDDVAASNLKLICAGGAVMEGFYNNGHTYNNVTYTGPKTCPTGKALCAIQTQVERYQFFGDDTTLNNVRARCCSILSPSVPAFPEVPVIGVTDAPATAKPDEA